MPRKEATVVIPDTPGNRDKGKVFVLKEMDAFATAKWGERAAFAVLDGARDRISDNDVFKLINFDWDDETSKEKGQRAGLALVASPGYRVLTGVNPDVVGPLLDELMKCVKIVPDPKNPSFSRDLLSSGEDIEEASTIYRLKAEVFALHTGFSMVAVLSRLSTRTAMEMTSPGSSTTQTSPA